MAAELSAPRRRMPRRRMPQERRHTVFGALVLAGLAVLFALSAGRDRGALGAYTLTARFPSAEGLYIDSPVRLAGVRIGRVAGMGYESQTQRAVLSLEIEPGIELPYDSIAIVTSEGMLGGRFVRLDPGGDPDALEDGDEIDFTQGSILFEELLAKVITTVEQRRLARRDAENKGAEGSQ